MDKKRKHRSLFLKDKARLIEEVVRGTKLKKVVASEFGIPHSTLSTIMKNKENVRHALEDDSVGPARKRFKPLAKGMIQ